MPVNNMSVGRDYSFGYYDADLGEVVDLGSIQHIKITPLAKEIANEPYNEDPIFGYIEGGYSFSFTIIRTGPEAEDFQLRKAQRFREGLEIKSGYLNETVKEPGGEVSRYQYERFVFRISELGDVQRDGTIKMSATGKASRKVKLGGI